MFGSSIKKTYVLIACLFVISCLMAGCSSEKAAEKTEPEKTIGEVAGDVTPGQDAEEEPVRAEKEPDAPDVNEVTDESTDTPEPENTADFRNVAPEEQGTAEEDVAEDAAEAQPEPEADPVPDTTPPVFKEYRSHLVYIGDTVSYRSGVILTDDSGEEPVLTIDSSQVNLKEAGEYPLTYTATDAAGNTASCEVTVVVREREDVTQEMLDAKADEIIESVLGDSERDIEALEKLFKWTKKNIHYVNYFEQKDDISAAWEGLMYERGDCYVYACASKELLTRAGFKNDMIRTVRHYWNLVDLGEGWYHYDTCPRKDKPYFFMWGDEQLMEYSKANGNSHDYDHKKWPDVMP